MDIALALSARLTRLRLAKGESLQQVADAVGVSKAHIWELEKGRTDNPSMALVTPLADHFGLSLAALVGEIQKPMMPGRSAACFDRPASSRPTTSRCSTT